MSKSTDNQINQNQSFNNDGIKTDQSISDDNTDNNDDNDQKDNNQIDEKDKKKEELQKKCEEYLAGWQRAKADYSNLQKDLAREKADFIKFANQSLILELIPIFDNFREAMSHIPDIHKTDDWVAGIELVKKQINDFLKDLGMEIYGKEGERFDPNLYEALDEVEKQGVESEVIIKVVKPGYKLHGKVIRACQVIISIQN